MGLEPEKSTGGLTMMLGGRVKDFLNAHTHLDARNPWQIK